MHYLLFNQRDITDDPDVCTCLADAGINYAIACPESC
jgi:hypothetical protein